LISSRLMTGIHRRSPSFLAKVVFPDPAWPVTMMHFGLLFMFLDAQRLSSGDAGAGTKPAPEKI